MAAHDIVYYHYYRHHREKRREYAVTEREQAAASKVAKDLSSVFGQTVLSLVEHFDVLPEPGSKYYELLATRKDTIVVMPDMRMFAQTAGVKGLRLLRDSIEAGIVPVILSEVGNESKFEFNDLLNRHASVIRPLTAHIDNEKPHGTGRQRTQEITALMRSCFEQIHTGKVHSRESLLEYLQSQVALRYASSAETIPVFEPTAWRTYQYKVRRKIEEMVVATFHIQTGREVQPESIWSAQVPSTFGYETVACYVSEACIRQLDNN